MCASRCSLSTTTTDRLRRGLLKALAALVVTVMLAPAAFALDPHRSGNGSRQAMDRDAAAAAARRATGGRVLGVERRRGNGDEYRVRVLTPDGTVRTLEIDGRSGGPRR